VSAEAKTKIDDKVRRPLTMRRFLERYALGIVAILVSIVVFIVPFVFIFLTAVKNKTEASLFEFSLPKEGWHLWENVVTVLETRDWMLVRAFINSTILTVASVAIMVVFAAMVGYVLQRRKSRWNHLINLFVLAGLIVPPRGRPDDLGAAGVGPVQDHAGHDPDRGDVRAVVLHPAVPRVHLHHSPGAGRGGDHRRRGPGPAVLPFTGRCLLVDQQTSTS
jgi:hypothetical protein